MNTLPWISWEGVKPILIALVVRWIALRWCFYVSRLILFNLRWGFKLWRQEGRRATIRGVIPRISISNTNPAVTTRVYIREVAAGRAHNPQIGVYIGSVLRNWLTLRRLSPWVNFKMRCIEARPIAWYRRKVISIKRAGVKRKPA